MSRIRLGTRGSRLAMAQATKLSADLKALHPDLEVEIVTVKTSGDQGLRDQLGAFVKEIQDALLENRVDIALHCLKDLPTSQVPNLVLAAHLEREDSRDTMITRGPNWTALPTGSIIGTGSVRRTSQLSSQRTDFTYRPLIGNIDTRMRKLQNGDYDAIVLAIAGLKRLGVLATWAESEYADLRVIPLSDSEMLPAPGQAVLVLETRESDVFSKSIVAPLHHEETFLAVTAEREFLKAFGGGCSVPIAAKASIAEGQISLEGLVASPDGSTVLRGSKIGPSDRAAELGSELAAELSAQGARELFNAGSAG